MYCSSRSDLPVVDKEPESVLNARGGKEEMLCNVCHSCFSEETQISTHIQPERSPVINDLPVQGFECKSRFWKDRE